MHPRIQQLFAVILVAAISGGPVQSSLAVTALTTQSLRLSPADLNFTTQALSLMAAPFGSIGARAKILLSQLAPEQTMTPAPGDAEEKNPHRYSVSDQIVRYPKYIWEQIQKELDAIDPALTAFVRDNGMGRTLPDGRVEWLNDAQDFQQGGRLAHIDITRIPEAVLKGIFRAYPKKDFLGVSLTATVDAMEFQLLLYQILRENPALRNSYLREAIHLWSSQQDNFLNAMNLIYGSQQGDFISALEQFLVLSIFEGEFFHHYSARVLRYLSTSDWDFKDIDAQDLQLLIGQTQQEIKAIRKRRAKEQNWKNGNRDFLVPGAEAAQLRTQMEELVPHCLVTVITFAGSMITGDVLRVWKDPDSHIWQIKMKPATESETTFKVDPDMGDFKEDKSLHLKYISSIETPLMAEEKLLKPRRPFSSYRAA